MSMFGYAYGQVKRWIKKSAPSSGTSSSYMYGFLDAYKSRKPPRPIELLSSYKNIAYACAQINARAVASIPLRLYHKSETGRAPKNFPSKLLSGYEMAELRKSPGLAPILATDMIVREISDHPLLKLLQKPNPFHSRFNLIEWSMLSQDILGDAYWSFEWGDIDGVEIPIEIWPLQAHLMTPIPDLEHGEILLHYEYAAAIGKVVYAPNQLIHFKATGLLDPYLFGMSPLRSAFEQVTVSDKLLAYEEALLDNRARPDMLITPKDVIGKDEAKRLERKFQQQFRGGGSGGIVVAESGFDYKSLNFAPADLASLEVRKVSKEEIANAFGVPISMLQSRDVNRSNAESGHYQHAKLAVLPRCRTFEEFLNMKLCPLYDPNIFLAFDNPVPEDAKERRETRRTNIVTGVHTINEERQRDGLPPVAGGDYPYMPGNYYPIHTLESLALSAIAKNTAPAADGTGGITLPPMPTARHPADDPTFSPEEDDNQDSGDIGPDEDE